jgi:hypothetical protein
MSVGNIMSQLLVAANEGAGQADNSNTPTDRQAAGSMQRPIRYASIFTPMLWQQRQLKPRQSKFLAPSRASHPHHKFYAVHTKTQSHSSKSGHNISLTCRQKPSQHNTHLSEYKAYDTMRETLHSKGICSQLCSSDRCQHINAALLH